MSQKKKPTDSPFMKFLKSKEFKRFSIPVIILIIGIILIVTAPWQTDVPHIEDPSPEPITSPTPEQPSVQEPNPETPPIEYPPVEEPPFPTPTPTLTGIRNPLTGEQIAEDLSQNRPFSISIGNTRVALPQEGIAAADIIYEYIVEGTETRLLAVYQDLSNVGTIGSTRSARQPTLDLSTAHDAICVHAGGRDHRPDACSEINEKAGGVTTHGTLDSHRYGYRDTYRRTTLRMSSEHTLMVKGELLAEAIPEAMRAQHAEGYDQGLYFIDDGKPNGGTSFTSADVQFHSGSKRTVFTYSPSENVFYVRQHGRDLTDGYSNTVKPSFTNVLVIATQISPTSCGHGHRVITTTGEGTGYYLNGGEYIEIKWSRNENAPFRYFRADDNTPLEIGVGKTYICVVSKDLEPPTFS